MTPDRPAFNRMTLVEAAAAVAARQVTAVQLLQSSLAAIDAHEDQVNATIWIDRDGAMQAAEAADQAVSAGAPLGPLHGVPLAHKDMYYQKGRVSTCGSMIRGDFVPDRTATVLDRLHAAGSITFAGLNMAEFAQNPTGHNRHHGDCHNPWGLPYITGGSSSGSGAAVAARFVFAALGSDTGGSIRLPASACGVTGLKPTQTRVSRAGVMPLSFSADNVGPLTRTARDCARIMSVIAGHDGADPTSSVEPVPDYEAALTGDLRGMRVGLVTNPGLMGTDARVMDAIAAATQVLKARGATVIPIELPLMDAVSAYVGIVSRCEGAAIHARWMRDRPEDYAVHLSARLYAGYAIPATYYVEALSARGPILKAFAAEVFSQVDVIALPSIPTILPTLAATDIDHGPPGTESGFMAVSVNTRPFNYLGLPGISIPCGFDPNGLPIGLQIVGRPFAEARVMAVADAYQQDTKWHAMTPPLIG
jgi:aspartyl-tRNA(Asn)/glutamyl-tRNA(Gln) amidotransferase subunit A